MKKILAVVLSVAALASTTSALAATYSDVPENAWYTGYVNKFQNLKVLPDMKIIHSVRIIRLLKRNL